MPPLRCYDGGGRLPRRLEQGGWAQVVLQACDRRRGRAYYDARKDELYAQRVAAREAARQAELEALAEGHRERVAAMKKLHAAQVRHQKEFLRSIGVPDLSPEEITERARHWPTIEGVGGKSRAGRPPRL